ncbi:MAG: sulfotransferase family protein [Solirubrobacterales bacterium]
MGLLDRIRRRGRRDPQRAPAPFVVGIARSGTTLLRLMLDAHPELTIPPETHFLPRLFNHFNRWVKEGVEGVELRERAMELITSHPRWGDIDIDPEQVRSRMAEHDPLTAGDAARSLYEAYASLVGKPRWGDKSPPYTWKAKRIQRELPEAHFIHLIRDGRDVALSLSEVSWGPGDVKAAAAKWVDELRRARDRARRLAPGTYMELRFEDLVADPEPNLRRIAEFVELPWDATMLAYHQGAEERMSEVIRDFHPMGGGTITAEERKRQHELVSSPPSSSRVGRWRTEMSKEDRQAFEGVAGELLAELGYDV